MIDILKIKDYSNLKERVKRNDNRIFFLIHPFYSEDTNPNDKGRYITEEYKVRRDNFLKENLNREYPLVIFQPEELMEDLKEKLSGYNQCEIYVVNTKLGESTPIKGEEKWDDIVEIVKNVDAKYVELGGIFLDRRTPKVAMEMFELRYDSTRQIPRFIDNMSKYSDQYRYAREWLDENLVPRGCVGLTAINLLERGIDVKFSNITSPD